jgi:hypothetical protein
MTKRKDMHQFCQLSAFLGKNTLHSSVPNIDKFIDSDKIHLEMDRQVTNGRMTYADEDPKRMLGAIDAGFDAYRTKL